MNAPNSSPLNLRSEGDKSNIVKSSSKTTNLENDSQVSKYSQKIKDQTTYLEGLTFLSTEQSEQYKSTIKDIYVKFEEAMTSLQNTITVESLNKSKLLDNLGKDLPQEDIDRIYYVHCEQDVKDTPGKRKNKVVASIQKLGKESKEYKLALEYRLVKYRTQLTNFFKSYASNNIREISEVKVNQVNQFFDNLKHQLYSSAIYQSELENVEKAKAKLASKKLRLQRAREKAKTLQFVVKTGVIAVLEGTVSQTRKEIISQFDQAVNYTNSELEFLRNEDEKFDPRTNVKDYEKLVENVNDLLRIKTGTIEEDNSDSIQTDINPKFLQSLAAVLGSQSLSNAA